MRIHNEVRFVLFKIHYMRMNTQLNEVMRILRNLIRTGIVTDVDHDEGLCRVQTGGMETSWLKTGSPVAPVARGCGGLPRSVSRFYCSLSTVSSIRPLRCRAYFLMIIPCRQPHPMRFTLPFLMARSSSTSPKAARLPCQVSKPPTSPRRIPSRPRCRWCW